MTISLSNFMSQKSISNYLSEHRKNRYSNHTRSYCGNEILKSSVNCIRRKAFERKLMLVPLWNAQDFELRWIYTALSTSVSVSNMRICSSVVLWQNRKALIRFYCAAFRLYSFYNQKLQRITASCLFPTVKSNNVLKKAVQAKINQKNNFPIFLHPLSNSLETHCFFFILYT